MKWFLSLLFFIFITNLSLAQQVNRLTYIITNYNEGRSYREEKFINADYAISYLKSMGKMDHSISEINDLKNNDLYGSQVVKVSKDQTTFTKPCNLDFNLFHLRSKNIYYRFKPDFRSMKIEGAKLLLVKDSLEEFQWNLLDEVKHINGVECQKAVLKFRCHQYTAWINLEIPISDGPEIFDHAPGLIVELERDDKNIKWQLEQCEINLTSETINFDKIFNNLKECQSVNYCDMKSDFDNFIKQMEKVFGARDCKTCESKITGIVIDECFDECK